MKNLTIGLIVVLGLAAQVNAEQVFNEDAVIDFLIDSPVSVVNGAGPSTVVDVIAGAELQEGLNAYHTSTVNVFNGDVNQRLIANDSSTVNVFGGQIAEFIAAYNSGIVNLSGGLVDERLYGYDSSTLNVSGGQIAEGIYAYGDSTVNVFGFDLAITDNVLTGTLADGTPVHLSAVGDGQFVLHAVPEPSTFLLLALGAGVLLLSSRRRPKG